MAVAVRDPLPLPHPRPPSPGIAAVLGVLEALDRHGSAGLAELCSATGLPKSTLHRACIAMEERGFVERRDEGRYALAVRAVELGTRSSSSALAAAFRAEATELRRLHNETTCLVVLDADDALFIAKVETTQAVRLVTRIGSRLPAFAAASGRVLLAALAPDTVDAMYAGDELVTPTGRRLDGLGELHRILGRARANGYAENVNETALGLTCLAVPITGTGGRVLAAMTLCVPAGRMDAPRRERMLADLGVAAGRASATVRAIHKPPGTG